MDEFPQPQPEAPSPLDTVRRQSLGVLRSMRAIPLEEITNGGSGSQSDDYGAGTDVDRYPVSDTNRHPFEVYPVSYTAGDTSPNVNVAIAWGTVCRGDEKNVAENIETELDAIYALTPTNCLIYLAAIFNADGSFSSLVIDAGPINSFVCSYVNGPGAGQNTWYHPIAHYRSPRTSKSVAWGLDGDGAYPDSGEFPHSTRGPNASPVTPYTIAQLTNTHLVGQQQCMTDAGGTTRTAWKLVPGPGATTGAGA